MDIQGLHIFGNLTSKAKSSKTIDFKTVDSDNSGAISETEWDKASRLYKCDTLEFSMLDKNGDGEISEEEFATIKQNVQLQKKLDALIKKQISKDFGGIDAEYLPDMVEILKEFALEYAEVHDGEEDIATTFEEELIAFYNEQKEILLENAPSRIQSRVLDNVYETLVDDSTPKAVKNAIFAEMEKVSNEYIKKHYADPTLEEDLEAYLTNYMNTSEVEKLQEAWDKYNEKQASYREQVDASELERLKNDAEAFLRAALENHVEVKLGNTTIKNISTIATALKKYKNADALRADMQAIFDNLSTVSKRDDVEIKTCVKETESIAKEIKTQSSKVTSIANSLESVIKAAEENAKNVDSETLREIIAATKEALAAARKAEAEIKKLQAEAEELKEKAAKANSAYEAERLLDRANELLERVAEYKETIETLNNYTKQIINKIVIAGTEAAKNSSNGVKGDGTKSV